jgi:hypothetical protein
MGISKMRIRTLILALMVTSGTLFAVNLPGTDRAGEAPAATKNRGEARQSLDQVMKLLRGVDTAYASGNSAEAQSRFDQARSAWNRVSPSISAREAREAQLMFDNLGNQLKSSVPPTQVKSTVAGMLDELREDIEGELRR